MALRPAGALHPRARPVVLVHGWMATSAVLRPLANYLLARGVPEVVFVDYPMRGATLEVVIDAIAREVGEVHRRTGAPVDVVAHSLGAFATRTWIKRRGGAPLVHRFVSIGGPHAGTWLHPVLPGGLRGVLDPRGSCVAGVNEGPEPVATFVVRARFDHQILPPVAARVPGATEVVLEGFGHSGLLFAPACHEAVLAALRANYSTADATSS